MNFTLHKVELETQTAAEKIHRLRESMIDDFVLLCHEEIDVATRISRDGLVDSMPVFFDNLEAGLLTGRTLDNIAESSKIGSQHGKVRAQQRCFTIDDITVEYRILARVIFQRLREGATLTPESETIILDAILRGFGNAVSSFTEFRTFTRKNFIDGTKEKLARALEQSQAELESFFMHAEEPMFMTVGRNHRFTLANEYFEKIVQRSVLGESLAKTFEHEEIDDLLLAMNMVFETGSYYSSEIELLGNGYKIYLHPRWDAHGMVKGMMGVLQIPSQVSTKRDKRMFIEVRHH
ncbi:MAG TPA: hypothetical protein VNJ08_01750 [Bacteriovoracaceae bacterium]|nr:hypothetical protein [Bacteriovoracaceae bacterium]